jgi:hypothetical protein
MFSLMNRFASSAWLELTLTGLIVAIGTLAAAQERESPAGPASSGKGTEVVERRREGTKFEGAGRFEITGDRVSFYPAEGQESFRVLENLALERVARVQGESREQREWQVAAVYTEYQGINYLLLTRAVVKQSATKAPAKH